jgi:hypothetical protein
LIPDTRFLQFLGWDDHYFRFISTLLDPGFTGIVLLLSLYLLYQLFFQRFSWLSMGISHLSLKAQTVFLWIGSFTLTLGISLTYSRASYLAFLSSGAIAILFLIKKKQKQLWLPLFASLVFLVLSLPFLPRPTGEGVKLERTSTIVSRTSTIQQSVHSLKSWQWLTGTGFFVSNENQLLATQLGNHNRLPDNWLIMLVTEVGGVGTVLVGFWVIDIARKNWHINPWFWLSLTAVFIHGLFNASLVYVFVLLWLGVLFVPLQTRETKKSHEQGTVGQT